MSLWQCDKIQEKNKIQIIIIKENDWNEKIWHLGCGSVHAIYNGDCRAVKQSHKIMSKYEEYTDANNEIHFG